MGRAGRTLRLTLVLAIVSLVPAAGGTALAGERSGSAPRIVGGNTTTIAEWPWHVAIANDPEFSSGNGFQRQFCGGSLVAPSIVVTAAHCVYGGVSFTNPDLYSVITGRTTLSSSQGQEIEVADYHYFTDTGSGIGSCSADPPPVCTDPELYDDSTTEWDAVVMQLTSASSSQSIKIAGGDEAAVWEPDRDGWVTGWGDTSEGGSPSDVLRAAHVPIVADSFCSSSSSYGTEFFPETMLCAGPTAGGRDTCQGDSGGPLVVPVTESDATPSFRLVGDTSWGFGCARPNFPGVYGRLAADPMRSAIQALVQNLEGVDVVGSGAQPRSLPGPAPGAGPGPGPSGGTDSTAPETTITGGPKTKTKRKTATFTFDANEPATFNCTLDGQEQFKPCASPTTVKVGKGRHSFQVRATDPAGNVDASPAIEDWRVRRKKR